MAWSKDNIWIYILSHLQGMERIGNYLLSINFHLCLHLSSFKINMAASLSVLLSLRLTTSPHQFLLSSPR